MKTLKELQDALDANIPRSAVKSRQGAGRMSFSYLSTDYVIDRNNKLFGNLNWSSDTLENKCVYEGQVNGKHCVSYVARVKIEAQHIDENGRVVRTSHCGTGYGDGSDANNPGKAHELAAKESESDALKRACKNFGQSMGLALYDKDQANVEEDAPAGKTVPAPGIQTPIPTREAPVLTQPNAANATAGATPKAVSGASGSRPSAAGAHDSRPQGAPTNRDQLNKNISTISKIVMAKGKATQAELEAEVKKHGADKKEDLTDEAAQKLFDALKGLAG